MAIYAASNNGLGDQWAFINWCIRQSVLSGQPVLVADQPGDMGDRTKYRHGRLAEIIQLLKCPGEVRIVDGEPDEHIFALNEPYPYFPTKQEWTSNFSKKIAYAPPAIYLQKHSPPLAQRDMVMLALQEIGYETIELSPAWSLTQIVNVLASVEFYVGESTGYTHMSHSVGNPTYLITGQGDKSKILGFHSGQNFCWCQDWEHFFVESEVFWRR